MKCSSQATAPAGQHEIENGGGSGIGGGSKRKTILQRLLGFHLIGKFCLFMSKVKIQVSKRGNMGELFLKARNVEELQFYYNSSIHSLKS